MRNYLQHSEHRWGDRIKVDIPVQVALAPLSGFHGCLKNISLSGALMQLDVDLRINSLVEICIEVPAKRAVLIEAFVTRKLDYAVGVEWCNFAPGTIKEVIRCRALRSDD